MQEMSAAAGVSYVMQTWRMVPVFLKLRSWLLLLGAVVCVHQDRCISISYMTEAMPTKQTDTSQRMTALQACCMVLQTSLLHGQSISMLRVHGGGCWVAWRGHVQCAAAAKENTTQQCRTTAIAPCACCGKAKAVTGRRQGQESPHTAMHTLGSHQ